MMNMNDLETFLWGQNCNCATFEFQYDHIALYFILFVLIYSHDTVVFETDENLCFYVWFCGQAQPAVVLV